jgi:hypothetical protein
MIAFTNLPAATATASRWIVFQSEALSAGNARPMMVSAD